MAEDTETEATEAEAPAPKVRKPLADLLAGKLTAQHEPDASTVWLLDAKGNRVAQVHTNSLYDPEGDYFDLG